MRTFSIIIISLFFCAGSYSQALNSNVSSDSILLGNYFIYEITIENLDREIDLPNLEEFQIVSGPNVSSSISIVNGKRSSTKSYTWYLKPIDLGQYYIDPLGLNVDGDVYETEPLEINVFPNPDGIIVEPKQQNSNDFFSFPGLSPFEQKPQSPPAKKIKSKRELKKG